MKGFVAVLRKEAIQMRRDKGTLRFAIGVPIFQLFLFGVIDTNVRFVPTVVFDQSRTVESRQLVRDFENTRTFDITAFARSRGEMHEEIVAGDCRSEIAPPADAQFGRRDVFHLTARVRAHPGQMMRRCHTLIHDDDL